MGIGGLGCGPRQAGRGVEDESAAAGYNDPIDLPLSHRAAPLCWLALLGACATPQGAAPAALERCIPPWDPTPFHECIQALGPGALAEPRAAVVHPGDSVHYALTIRDGAAVDHRLMGLLVSEVLPEITGIDATLTAVDGTVTEFRSRAAHAFVSLVPLHQDGDAASNRVNLPIDFLLGGQVRASALGAHSDDDATVEQSAAARQGVMALMSILKVVEGEPVLGELLMRMVSLRDKISVLFAGGLSLDVDYRLAAAMPPVEPWSETRPTWCVPVTIRAGERALVAGHFLVTEPLSPLGACSGLLGLHVHDASDPARSLSLRLLHAKAGRSGRE